VLDALDEGVALTDTRGRIVFVNAALRRFCGCSGTQTFSEGPPACEVARRLESALRPLSLPDQGVAPRAPVILMRQVDPPHRVLERREMVQRAPDGAPLGTATIYRDVTERQTERARNDRFLTSVAHELRTPLTCITGHAGLLDQRLPGLAAGQPDEAGARWARETTSRSLRAIRRQVARMDRLLGDVLDTAQLERGTLALQVEEADVAGLVRAVIEDVAEMAPKHRVDLDAPTVLMARCDATRVEHIVYNLLSNAARFSPAGGAIHVTLRTAGAPGGPNALGHALVLTIGDEGPGVPLEASERIFERYADHDTVVTRDIPGMGIRLAISRALAERHGGSLRLLPASPEHAHGSTFELRLPLS
jgi:signal transduction histidine kinase